MVRRRARHKHSFLPLLPCPHAVSLSSWLLSPASPQSGAWMNDSLHLSLLTHSLFLLRSLYLSPLLNGSVFSFTLIYLPLPSVSPLITTWQLRSSCLLSDGSSLLTAESERWWSRQMGSHSSRSACISLSLSHSLSPFSHSLPPLCLSPSLSPNLSLSVLLLLALFLYASLPPLSQCLSISLPHNVTMSCLDSAPVSLQPPLHHSDHPNLIKCYLEELKQQASSLSRINNEITEPTYSHQSLGALLALSLLVTAVYHSIL